MTMTKKDKLVLSGTAKVEPPKEGEPLKVVFEPGCFDHIDVESQEELDKIMAEITDMFTNLTPEELHAQSRPLTDEDIEAMDPEEREAFLQAISHHVSPEDRKNRLQ
jgi:TRAP-type C4-dicarboxylate transport system substrate-binding protein